MQKLYDFFLKDFPKEDIEKFSFAKLTVGFCLIAAFLTSLYSIIAAQIQFEVSQNIIFLDVFLYIGLAFLLKWTTLQKLVARLFLSLCWLTFFILVRCSGGIYSSILPWLLLLPVLAYLLGKRSEAYVWCGIACLTVAFLSAIQNHISNTPVAYSKHWEIYFFTSTYIGLVVVLLMIVQVFDKLKNNPVHLLQQQNKEIAAKNLELEKIHRKIALLQEEFLQQQEYIGKQNKGLLISNKKLRHKEQVLTQNLYKVQKIQNELQAQNQLLAQRESYITTSIEAAQTIQQAILPAPKVLESLFEDYFLIYLPKDLVSGDFYWVEQTQKHLFLAVIDCTGHGVPGAFMSMIGNTLLYEIIHEKNMHDPAQILMTLHHSVKKSFQHEEDGNIGGMDMGLCRITYPAKGFIQVLFAGARHNLLYSHQNNVNMLQGTRMSLGGWRRKISSFENQAITLQKGDKLYLTTDGYFDTPNPVRQSFSKQRFIQLLQSISSKNMSQQKEILLDTLTEHRQGTEQRDDITVLGVEL